MWIPFEISWMLLGMGGMVVSACFSFSAEIATQFRKVNQLFKQRTFPDVSIGSHVHTTPRTDWHSNHRFSNDHVISSMQRSLQYSTIWFYYNLFWSWARRSSKNIKLSRFKTRKLNRLCHQNGLGYLPCTKFTWITVVSGIEENVSPLEYHSTVKNPVPIRAHVHETGTTFQLGWEPDREEIGCTGWSEMRSKWRRGCKRVGHLLVREGLRTPIPQTPQTTADHRPKTQPNAKPNSEQPLRSLSNMHWQLSHLRMAARMQEGSSQRDRGWPRRWWWHLNKRWCERVELTSARQHNKADGSRTPAGSLLGPGKGREGEWI